MEKYIDELIKKAVETTSPHEAVMFSQAACNAANAVRALADAKATR